MGRHVALTKEHRLAIVRQSHIQPKWSQKELGQWVADTYKLTFVPSQPTVSIVLRQGGKLAKPRASKTKQSSRSAKKRVVKCPQVDKAMLRWLETQIVNDEAVTVTKVRAKAQEIVHQLQASVNGFVVSDDWVDIFIRRHVLNCSFGLSDVESTDSDEDEEDIEAVDAAAKCVNGDKAGKTSRRLIKASVTTRTPATGKEKV